MLIKNIGFESVEWLIDHGKVLSLHRSEEDYIPAEVEKNLFTFTYMNWVDLTVDTGDFLNCPHILKAPKGYDVEVESIEGDFPQEILERLQSFREIKDNDKDLF